MSENPRLFGWASDVPISMPKAPDNDPDFGLGAGFAMTRSGIAADITEAMAKRLSTPTFQPKEQAQTVYEDVDLTDGSYDEDMRTF